MAFVPVARVDEIPEGRGHRVQVDDVDVGLFRVDGALFAMENRCPHADASLHEGCLEGHVVICPAHAWEFDVRTGFRPGGADGFPIPCFAVRVLGDVVEVDLDQILNRPPRGPR